MKPNFETMSNKELIQYILTHRDELEPLHVLYERRTPDAEVTWYPAPCTPDGEPIEENLRIMEEAIRQRLEKGKKS